MKVAWRLPGRASSIGSVTEGVFTGTGAHFLRSVVRVEIGVDRVEGLDDVGEE
jgi:hypothetical protein